MSLGRLAEGFLAPVALVGGAIRDALLGLPVEDLDLIVIGDLDAFIAVLEARVGRRPALIGDRFQNTHRFRWHGTQVDIAQAQGDVRQDLGRRDFTINAMGVRLGDEGPAAERLIDPNGGTEDLRRRSLRYTTAAALSDDPLRTLRAVRYATSLPGFELELQTRAAVAAASAELGTVAHERVRAEWLLILAQRAWLRGVELADELGIVTATLGTLRRRRALDAWAAFEPKGTDLRDAMRSRLTALVVDLSDEAGIDTVGTRLLERRWPRRLVATASRAASWVVAIERGQEQAAEWALRDRTAAEIAARLVVALARATGSPLPEAANRLSMCARRAAETPWVGGADLLAAGMEPGPAVGDLLGELRRGQLERRWADRDAALRWAHARLARETEGGRP